MRFILSISSEISGWCDYFSNGKAVAVDTEFCRVTTYWPKLALIQLSDGKETVLIDPLMKGIDLAPVRKLLENSAVTKIFHSCRQDLELLLKVFGSLPANLYDTQLAYTFLYPVEEVSLARMLEEQLGVVLNKSKQNSNWMKRPLPESQLIYAANDVFYLSNIKDMLTEKLLALGRYEWFLEDQSAEFVEEKFYPITTYWLRLAKRGNHKSKQLHILKSLCDWRENVAQTLNYNRKRVISDEAILMLAEQGEKADLSEINLPETHIGQFIDLWQEILSVPEDQWPPKLKRKPMTIHEQEYLDYLRLTLSQLADELKISDKVIATSDDLKRFVRGDKTVPFMKGWRFNVFGQKVQR